MKQGADWLAWFMQFVVGLVVGALIGTFFISRGRRGGYWLAEDQVPDFLWGAALVWAGLASFYGDRLWIGLAYRVIPPNGIEHSPLSRFLSLATLAGGGGLILMALLRHFGVIAC